MSAESRNGIAPEKRWRMPFGHIRNLFFLLTVSATLFFGIFATPKIPQVLEILGRPDLALHFLAFASCAFFAPGSGRRQPVLLVLLLLAGGIELVQLMLQDRSVSLSDFAAGVAGICIGWLASLTTGRLLARSIS